MLTLSSPLINPHNYHPMRIAINGNRHQEGHFDQIKRLVDTVLKRGFDVVLAEPFLDYLTLHLGDDFAVGLDYKSPDVPPHADLAISIGGDGALLKTARWIGSDPTPVAGINTGHLGYLSAYTFDCEEEIYSGLLRGDFTVESRSLLRLRVENATLPLSFPTTALNEIALTRGDNASILRIEVRFNGSSPLNYLGDGLIIATPTGSTAYNLSVGGPVLSPDLRGMVLSPVAAHSLSMRPLVVGDACDISVKINTRGTSFRLSVDGKSVSLPLEADLHISRADWCVQLVMQPGHTFTDTLRDKLGMKGFI